LTSVNSVNSYTAQTTSSVPKKEMGKEQFLQILVAQLQNQDPSQPMQDGEMITQMSQLSVLEQLSNLNQSFTTYLNSNQKDLSQYANMLDKKVTWTNPDTAQQESGIVTGIKNMNNQVYFTIDNQVVPASEIIAVEDK
jgi:flagellar basal-body rod modification protein FlgD